MAHFVYILASRPNGALYIGRTSNIAARLEAHRSGTFEGHTKRFRITCLVWLERHKSFETSLRRERSLKRWRREWKNALIAEHNPNWDDITHAIPA